MMLLQCEEAGGKNHLGPPACLRFHFLPSCRHYGSLESRNSKIPPDCHPYRSKLLYCTISVNGSIYSTHPKLYTTIKYRLLNNTKFSCYSYLVFSQTKKTKHFLFIYLGQMVYSHFLDFSHVFVKGLAVLERSEGLFRRADAT